MTPETLTLIRKAEKQSISAFAVRLGISRNTLGGYERGLQPIPNYIALAAVAIYRRLDLEMSDWSLFHEHALKGGLFGAETIWSTLGGVTLQVGLDDD